MLIIFDEDSPELTPETIDAFRQAAAECNARMKRQASGSQCWQANVLVIGGFGNRSPPPFFSIKEKARIMTDCLKRMLCSKQSST